MSTIKNIKESKSGKLLIGAIAFGLLAAFLAIGYIKLKENELRALLTPDDQKVSVVVARKDLIKGEKIDINSGNFAVRPIPREYVHSDAMTPAQFETLTGQKLVQNVAKGKAILRSFVDLEFPRDFSDTIPLKRRAMTIQVDEINSVNGFIRPGNRIDLFVNLPAGAVNNGESASDLVIPVLENLEVLATGRTAAREYEERMLMIRGGVNLQPVSNYTSLTINVTPREAALLTTAQEKGDLLALLRNRKDDSGSGFTEVLPGDLLSQAEKLARDAAIRATASNIDNQGLVVGEDGLIRTKDGVVLKDQNLVVNENGEIMTKDGVVLSGRGLTINDKGELVTADGTVVDSSEITVAADGSIMTKDGKVLDGGRASNRVAGKALSKDDVTIREDGTLVTKDGKVLTGITMDKNGNMVDENGNPVVVTESGAVLKGVTTNEKGEIVLEDGTVVSADDVVIAADGTVMTKDGKKLAGVSADTSGVSGFANLAESTDPSRYDFIVGGVSKDGVATVNKVPVAD